MHLETTRIPLIVCGILSIACCRAGILRADETTNSTIRTVSVTGTANEKTAVAKSPAPKFTADNRAPTQSSANLAVAPSSIAFVSSSEVARPATQNYVRQVQYVYDAPIPTVTAPTKSSLEIENATSNSPQPLNPNLPEAGGAAPPTATTTANVAPANESVARTSRPTAAAPRSITQPRFDYPTSNQTQQTLERLGGQGANATLSQMPRRTPIRPAAAAPVHRPSGKPFQSVEHEPTVSPYLNLHRNDADDESSPNYFAFVRPQMEQLEATRRQQSEILRLQRQMQTKSPTVIVPQQRSTATPNTGTVARYMDTAQFYGAWQR